ncbi:hypothetical protein LCGC14_1545970 [marine sediment metagenome]|uniref:Uncharacterized protein n=1 Tax=marine sediment metagenome TaxID=412755 RepID=A0A0F9JCI9_9ZZZZ
MAIESKRLECATTSSMSNGIVWLAIEPHHLNIRPNFLAWFRRLARLEKGETKWIVVN